MKWFLSFLCGLQAFGQGVYSEREEFAAIRQLVGTARSTSAPTECHGRLTLTSGTAVTTADVTAATTVYFTPHNGFGIGLYNGSGWDWVTFTERSVAVPSTTVTPFDVFAYNNAGTVTLETLDWTNDTTRATNLTTQNGVYVKSGDATRRYLGTGRTTAVSGQTEDSKSKRYLWNACNREPKKLLAQATNASWSYDTSTWRPAVNSTTVGTTRVEWVAGLSVEPVNLRVFVSKIYHATAVTLAVGIGINSTTVNSANIYGGISGPANNPASAFYRGIPSVGYSYGQWLEFGGGGTGQQVIGTAATGGNQQKAGLIGQFWS